MRWATVQLPDGARALLWSRVWGAARLLAAGALVAAAYYVGAHAGFALSYRGPPQIVVLWPPTAILLAVVLLTPPRRWWIWLVAATVANIAVHLPLGTPAWRLAFMSVNTMLVALIAAGILRRSPQPLASFSGTLRFFAAVAAATLALPLVSAAIYVAIGMMSSFGDTWRLIAFANTLACLTLLPAILLTAQRGRAWLAQATPRGTIEAALLATLLLGAGQVVFGIVPGGPLSGPLIRMCILPLLLWAVVRFGPGGLSLALSALVLVATWNMSLGHGPFTRAAPLQNVFNLQIEFLAFAAPLLLFAVLIVERRQAEADLVELNAQLESRVAARTEELAHLNEQLAVARDQADAANRAKSDFLATMSHELRTPLHTVLGYNRLLLNSPALAPEQREQARVVQRGADHLLTLINNVLDLSKIEAGQTPLQPTTTSLPRLLDGLMEMFRLQAERKGLRLRCLVAPDIPRLILVDSVKLRQVLINLVANAVKFAQAGGVLLTMRCERRGDGPDVTLVFEVADTGPGISLVEQRQMFDAFVQTVAGQRLGEGSGLGLTISRQFVRLMGGELTVRSTIGHGTVFEGRIPAQTVQAAAAPRDEPPASALTLAPGQPAYRILVVDDHDDNRLLLISLLSSLGITARGARDGEEALATWLVWQPHFIFLDLRLPRRNGIEVARAIRAGTRMSPPTIIALSASGMDTDRTAALEAGCNDFIRKPFQDTEIVRALRHYLGVRFVTSSALPPLQPPLPAAETLDPAALAALPDELLATLEYVSIEGDPRRIAAVIAAVRWHTPALAAPLQSLAERVAFDVILDAVRAARAARGSYADT